MTSLMRRNARPIRHGAPPRLFGVGQAVRLKGDFRTPAKIADVYHVTAILPPRENSPQYRIRSDAEPHERVVTEDRLEPAGGLASDASLMLIERTFGHGQGLETLQPRGQEPKQANVRARPEPPFGSQIEGAAVNVAGVGGGTAKGGAARRKG